MTRLSDFTDAPLGAYVCEEGWLVVGDLAYLPGEWKGTRRPYRRLTDGERRTYKRDWMRRHRAAKRQASTVLHAVASLHSLACSGPTRDTGCRCRKTTLWRVA